jgi:hypothetical protein
VIVCFYKKSFLRDLAKLPKHYREQIERLVFDEIPKLDNMFATLDSSFIGSGAELIFINFSPNSYQRLFFIVFHCEYGLGQVSFLAF